MVGMLTVALFFSLYCQQIQSIPQGRFGPPYGDSENTNWASRLLRAKRTKILGDEERNMAKRDEIHGRFGPHLGDEEMNMAKRYEAAERNEILRGEDEYNNENSFLKRAGYDEDLGSYVKRSHEMENRGVCDQSQHYYDMACHRCPKGQSHCL
jgi:ribosomal protein L37AE/L43A